MGKPKNAVIFHGADKALTTKNHYFNTATNVRLEAGIASVFIIPQAFSTRALC
jgi:hypothetical protein